MKWGYESEVHKIRTFADLGNRPSAARNHMFFGHGSLPLGFASLCAHLAAFRFEMKSKDERRAVSAHRPIPRGTG